MDWDEYYDRIAIEEAKEQFIDDEQYIAANTPKWQMMYPEKRNQKWRITTNKSLNSRYKF